MVSPSEALEPSWDLHRALVSGPLRSRACATTGTWTLDVLEGFLGTGWPAAYWRANGHLPEFLSGSPGHVVALQELVEFGLLTDEVTPVDGFAQVRNPLRADLTVGRLMHARLQMEVAALARAQRHRTALEVKHDGVSPIDVVIDTGADPIGVETFTLLVDDEFRAARQYADHISDSVLRLQIKYDVGIEGSLDERLDDDATDRWLLELKRAALVVRSTGVEQVLTGPHGTLTIRPGSPKPGVGFTSPPISGQGWERTVARLREKAHQAAGAAAGWIRVDLRDGLWGFTPWSQQQFGPKVEALVSALAAAVGTIPLDGMVVSSGTVQTQGLVVGVSCRPPTGGFGMCRIIGPYRARETVIVPLSGRGFEQAPIWQRMYEVEPQWIDAALATRGLPPLRQVIEPRQRPEGPRPVSVGERPVIDGPLWPVTLRLPVRAPTLVYLDLNHWIALAKAHAGHPDGVRHVAHLQACLDAAAAGRAAFPISDSVLIEITNIGNHRQRRSLREVIEPLSGFRVITGRDVIFTHEIEAMLDLVVGASPRPINVMDYLDWGVARAFGMVGGFRVRRDPSGADVTAEARAQHAEGPEAFDRLLNDAEWALQRSVIDGPSLEEESELRALGWRPHPTSEVTESRLRQEIEQVARFNAHPRSRQEHLRDAVAAREVLIELNPTISEGIHDRGASLDDIFTDPDVTRRLTNAMPSFDVTVTIKAAYHRNPQHRWKRNDIHDIDALGSTVPYCDIVVTDTAVATHIRSAGLPERFDTEVLHDLDALVRLL
jgi:hypothetical protein